MEDIPSPPRLVRQVARIAAEDLFDVSDSEPDADTECSICRENLHDPHYQVFATACDNNVSHYFHLHCIQTHWDSRNGQGLPPVCPMCRWPIAIRPRRDIDGLPIHARAAGNVPGRPLGGPGPAPAPAPNAPAPAPNANNAPFIFPGQLLPQNIPPPPPPPVPIVINMQAPPPPAAAAPPAAPAPGNTNGLRGYRRVSTPFYDIVVPSQASYTSLKWVGLGALLGIFVGRGFNKKAVAVSTLFALLAKPSFRYLFGLWRACAFRQRAFRSPMQLAPANPVMNQPEVEACVQSIRTNPIVEYVSDPLTSAIASADSVIQHAASFMGLTDHRVTGRVVNVGTYQIPLTNAEIRPTNFTGTLASRNVVELDVSYIVNPSLQRQTIALSAPEVVNQLLTSTRNMVPAVRTHEIANRSSRVTDQIIPAPLYTHVLEGSAQIATILASAYDPRRNHLQGLVQDFPVGSPSIRSMVSDIAPTMGAPFLILVGMVLPLNMGLTFTKALTASLSSALWARL